MKPLIVLLIGLPGSGKTTVAKEVAESLQAIVLTTEVIHAQMLSENSIVEDRDFTPSELDLIYKVITILTHYLILAGKNVVVDGVFRSKQQRETIRNIASDLGVGLLPIHVTCSEAAILTRLTERKNSGTMSPSGQVGYRKVKREFEDADNSYFYIDTTNNDIRSQISNTLNTYNQTVSQL